MRCKVFRGADAAGLEMAINQFLEEELADEIAVQVEEITQSEGPDGVTVLVWYSVLEEAEEPDEISSEAGQGTRELA